MTIEQFRHWSAVSSDAVLLVEKGGRVLAANDAVEDLGLKRSMVEGKSLDEVCASDLDALKAYLRGCSRVLDPIPGSLNLKGEKGLVACSCRGMLASRPSSETGTPRLLISLASKEASVRRYTLLEDKIRQLNKEIGRRRELETELKRRNEYLQVTLTSIGDAVVVTDAGAKVALLNGVAEQLTGWSSEQAVGLPIEEVFHIVNETTRQPVENPVFQAVRDGVVVGLANHTVLISRDGTERPIDDSAAAILDGSGKVLGAVLVFRDITERHKNQERLNEQIQLFSQLADAIPQLVWMARPDGYIEWYNSRWYEYTGTTPEQVTGWGWKSVHDPEALPEVIVKWTKAIDAEEPLSMVFPLKGADGKFRPFLTRVLPFRDEHGRVTRWFGTNTDISEHKAMEDQLRSLAERLAEANRRKDEFLAMLAHELRNPLAPIRTGLELLKMIGDDPVHREETRSMMERQTKQLISLVDDLLDVSRITRGKLELRTQRVDLGAVIESAIETARPFIDEAGHDFHAALANHPVYVEADPNRLAQVFSNLLNIAAKYTPSGGRISLIVKLLDGEAVVSVIDNGVGIPRERLTDVFDMFTQIEYPQVGATPDWELALPLSRRLWNCTKAWLRSAVTAKDAGAFFGYGSPLQPTPAWFTSTGKSIRSYRMGGFECW